MICVQQIIAGRAHAQSKGIVRQQPDLPMTKKTNNAPNPFGASFVWAAEDAACPGGPPTDQVSVPNRGMLLAAPKVFRSETRGDLNQYFDIEERPRASLLMRSKIVRQTEDFVPVTFDVPRQPRIAAPSRGD